MRRGPQSSLVLICCLALAGLSSPASAQFELLDPQAGLVLPEESGANLLEPALYQWRIVGLHVLSRGAEPELLVLQQGTAPAGTPVDAGAGAAVGWQRYALRAGTLTPLQPLMILAGELNEALVQDLNGDGLAELVLRRTINRTPPPAIEPIPYTGRKPPKPITEQITSAYHFPAALPGMPYVRLLQYVAPANASEQLALVPGSAGHQDLLIASFGSHPSGPEAAPDAWLRFAWETEGGLPTLARQPAMVMTPVPIAQLVTADLNGTGTPSLVTLREFPNATYRQQLWLQRDSGQGFFENAAIGRGNDLTLLPPHPALPGIMFVWTDTKSTPPVTHLAALRVDAAGTPQQVFDQTLPWNVRVRGQAWGSWLPANDTPGLVLLLEPIAVGGATSSPWLARLGLDATGALEGIELHQLPATFAWQALSGLDLDGDGVDEVLGTDGAEIGAYSFLTRQVTTALAAPSRPPALPSDEDQLFSLDPEVF